MLEQGKLLTMEEFYEKWSHYLHNVYAVKVHRGLKNQGETYCTPQELFDKGERYEKALPPKILCPAAADEVRTGTGI